MTSSTVTENIQLRRFTRSHKSHPQTTITEPSNPPKSKSFFKSKQTPARQRAMNYVSAHNTPSIPGGLPLTYTRLLLRLFQFILGLTVCGLYGTDLDVARQAHFPVDSHWAYAVTIGGLSAFVALLFLIPQIPWGAEGGAGKVLFAIDGVLALLWVVVFGMFGKMYIGEDPEDTGHGDGPGIVRMKNAVWVDLTCVVLWIATAGWGLFLFLRGRKGRTLHTGRAEV
ncbi:hypothetical protein BT63DRAFT_421274 [Microthyrium microscopicum]|uniref:MARVEL domain-containing protein n=1 Tax=Microthyrium microscopicum TaxID=703497 RepID=A0A6A6UQ93_9PEZI|nr:hypothetical protein BT63DRAFT_421274 [Microthyrium microscopicum]